MHFNQIVMLLRKKDGFRIDIVAVSFSWAAYLFHRGAL